MNILDYVDFRGDILFTERPLNEVDNLIFSELSYLELASLFGDDLGTSFTISELCKLVEDAQLPVKRSILPSVEGSAFPVDPIIPMVEAVHDRAVVETFRGCTRGCRFCQAGMIYRPVRERTREKVMELALKQLDNTGHEELSLLSLSSSDHTEFEEMAMDLVDCTKSRQVSLALPSLRMDKFAFNMALERIWTVVRRANKYIDEKAPWILAKDEAKKDELDTVMNHLAETLRIVSILIYPFMHTTSEKIRKQLGIEGDIIWEDSEVFNMMNGEQVKKGEQIFPRLDVEKELAELTKIAEEEAAKKAAGAVQDPVEKAIAESVPLKLKDEIVYGDFDKMDFRVGTILKAEKHPNADKLLVFQVKMGTEVRQVISGVADSFTPEEMVGKKVVVVANLKPRMLRGLESHGMLLFAGDDGRNFVVTTDAPDGEIVS